MNFKILRGNTNTAETVKGQKQNRQKNQQITAEIPFATQHKSAACLSLNQQDRAVKKLSLSTRFQNDQKALKTIIPSSCVPTLRGSIFYPIN